MIHKFKVFSMQYVFKILNAEKWLTLLEIKPTCIISMYFDSNTCNGKLQKYLQWNNISQSIFAIKILYKIFEKLKMQLIQWWTSVTIHIPIYYRILKVYLSIIHNDSIEMWNTNTLNKQTKLYLLFKVKKTKISICPLLICNSLQRLLFNNLQ